MRIPHTLMGVLDVPLMLLGLHEWTGILVRPLGDHIHFQIRVWRDLLRHRARRLGQGE